MTRRSCSECGRSLKGRKSNALTCSRRCEATRALRVRKKRDSSVSVRPALYAAVRKLAAARGVSMRTVVEDAVAPLLVRPKP